jgi:hypothetical protein
MTTNVVLAAFSLMLSGSYVHPVRPGRRLLNVLCRQLPGG